MELDPIEKEAFASEVEERLEEYNDYLLDFEKAAEDQSILHKLFRVAHTIKGNAGFVGLTNMVEIAHAAENLLSLIRDGKLRLDQTLSDLLFSAGDLIKQILDAFLGSDTDPLSIDVSSTVHKIESAIDNHLPETKPQQTKPESVSSDSDSRAPLTAFETKTTETSALYFWNIEIELKKGIALPGMRAYLLRSKLEKIANILSESPSLDEYDNKEFAGRLSFLVESTEDKATVQQVLKNHEVESCQILPSPKEGAQETTQAQKASQGGTRPSTQQAPTHKQTETTSEAPPQRPNSESEALLFQVGEKNQALKQPPPRSIEALRVPIQKIDDILNLVGELLSANSAYLALTADFRAQYGNRGLYVHLRDNSEELSRISAELQEKVMRVRMVPVFSVFGRFRRLLRDYNSHHPDKEAILEILGEETEIDKKQMDNLVDPLMHLLRNALDHGIEDKETRRAKGKNPVGKILLKSYQDGNSIYIEVSDDGKGLDLEKIRAKAIERGLVSKEQMATYSDLELQNLIFLPGFSTASRVTDISGRGVGMDVVRKNIEAIGGSISIQNDAGRGFLFRIQIPLSMAVVTALKIFIGGQLFAIPISVILETTKVWQKDILHIEGSETIRLRDEHISLIQVGEFLGFPAKASSQSEAKKTIVVVQFKESKMALMVDELIGYEDMVIKSLSKNYEEIDGIAGAALLGRGEICLILDVHQLISSLLEKANPKEENGHQKLLAKLQGSPKKTSSDYAPTPSVATATKQSLVATENPPPAKAGLSSEQLRIIKEIVSQGRKAALRSLQKLTANTRLRMKVSSARIQPLHRFEAAIQQLCSQEGSQEENHEGQGEGNFEDCQAFYVNLEEDIRGNEIALLQKKSMIHLARMLYQDPSIQELNEEALSAIQELTNILAVSFTNAMAAVANLHVLPSPPYHVENAKEIFEKNLLFETDPSASILLVETEFIDPADSSMLRFYLLPDRKGFARLIRPLSP